MLNLKPMEISYSQDSISNRFDRKSRHSSTLIGDTLDDICERRCSISNIPTISVAKVDGRWVTADNRRLWVFRQLYRLNKCDTVPVHITYGIPSAKMTSTNKGVSIDVRGDAGSRWHRKQSVRSSVPTVAISKQSVDNPTTTASVFEPRRPSTLYGRPYFSQIATSPAPIGVIGQMPRVSNRRENIEIVDDIIKINRLPASNAEVVTSVDRPNYGVQRSHYPIPTTRRAKEPLRVIDNIGRKEGYSGAVNDNQVKERAGKRMTTPTPVRDDKVIPKNKSTAGNEETMSRNNKSIGSKDKKVAFNKPTTDAYVSITISHDDDDINEPLVGRKTETSTSTSLTEMPEVVSHTSCCARLANIVRNHPFKTVGIIVLVVVVVVVAVLLSHFRFM